jgi:2-keto-4-pentenoate hydratase/2-oxohepta-3-ene-1,7-dioic acid hydratase in catechol pathway
MRFITYRPKSEHASSLDHVGALTSDGERIVDLTADFGSLLALIDRGDEGMALARKRVAEAKESVALADVALRAPLPEPRQIRDFMTFELHYRQAIAAAIRMRVGPLAPLARALGIAKVPRVWYEQPIYYKCNRFSVVGPEADVIWPRGAELMDYECELAAVIGKTGKDIRRERALEHIFGFTIYNDLTARDLQLREMQARLGPAKGKDFDTGNVLGPWIVTRDEIDPYDLTMIARVNGEERGRGYSRDMHHRWEEVIAYVSRSETLHAGEILGSGTVGNGCGLEHLRFLEPGSVVELEITGIGKLRNRLVKP